MSLSNTSTREESGFEMLAKDLGLTASVIPKLQACITRRNVTPKQEKDGLKAALSRLATVRDSLQELYALDPTDEVSCEQVAAGFDVLEGKVQFSFRELDAIFDSLLQSANSPSTLVKLQHCRVQLKASQQLHLAAASLCLQGAEITGASVIERWKFLHQQAILLFEHGREFLDNAALQRSIDAIRVQVLPLAEKSGNNAIVMQSLETLGNVLGISGQRRSGTRQLEESIEVFGQARDLCDVNSAPHQWAALQNALGNALGLLGQRRADAQLIEQSIAAFELALTKRSEHSSPDEWASTMNNLAAVLRWVGAKNNDRIVIKRASESYKSVLRVWTRGRAPQQWAATMDNLGTSLRQLGEYRRGPRTLMQAVAAYNSALSERPREHFPNEWAMTQNNLGAALQKLAEREQDPAVMEQAIDAYENALKEFSMKKAPMTRAMTVANLAAARREFAAMTSDAAAAKKAVNEFESAIEVFRNASHAQYTELGEEQLASALELRDSLLSVGQIEK